MARFSARTGELPSCREVLAGKQGFPHFSFVKEKRRVVP